MYGYITNTKIKLVVVTEGDSEPSDNAVKQFLHQFHKLYIDTVCNPFHVLGAPLTSQRYVSAPPVDALYVAAALVAPTTIHSTLLAQVCHQPRTAIERHAWVICSRGYGN